ncbi:hypothetical protein DFH07DRAFT_178727 [Mycena maculata]|uniref:Uncharacterized protein n=1 Tax=Mycena maculata TaxID=230809 RepID=A0AAD7HW64_9AGAR|nr:hypothetical protein DFH07DRAFT_178727 [Mycena maculata]
MRSPLACGACWNKRTAPVGGSGTPFIVGLWFWLRRYLQRFELRGSESHRPTFALCKVFCDNCIHARLLGLQVLLVVKVYIASHNLHAHAGKYLPGGRAHSPTHKPNYSGTTSTWYKGVGHEVRADARVGRSKTRGVKKGRDGYSGCKKLDVDVKWGTKKEWMLAR